MTYRLCSTRGTTAVTSPHTAAREEPCSATRGKPTRHWRPSTANNKISKSDFKKLLKAQWLTRYQKCKAQNQVLQVSIWVLKFFSGAAGCLGSWFLVIFWLHRSGPNSALDLQLLLEVKKKVNIFCIFKSVEAARMNHARKKKETSVKYWCFR